MKDKIIKQVRKFDVLFFILTVVLSSHDINAQPTPALVFHDDFREGSTKWETTDDAS